MRMTKLLMMLTLLPVIASCNRIDTESVDETRLEQLLAANKTWPYEMIGVLQIDEAGGYGDSDYPDFAFGSLVTDGDTWGIPISIGDGVVRQAEIDIDSGKPVRVWLDTPQDEYGIKIYPVTKIRAE